MAEIYESTGNYDYASAYYQKIAQLEPSIEIFNKTGISLYNAKNMQKLKFITKKHYK